MVKTIPVIDFSAYHGSDLEAKRAIVDQIGQACRQSGFFQLINHGIPQSLQDDVLSAAHEFFALPLDVKEQYDKDLEGYNRGYERLRAQNFEKRTEGDLKEGYYFGLDLPLDHPDVVAKRFQRGPNRYPQHVSDPERFRKTVDEYFDRMSLLGETLVRVLCQTLGVSDEWVGDFVKSPLVILRMLHYPPQAPDASALERGIGAHTDFGTLTMLLQDMVGGLQVWDRDSAGWIDVVPQKGAFVVNLGNLMMRWTNDHYLSNLHRVINKSGQERYSIPFFFNGNPDFAVKCFPQCEDAKLGAKYSPVTVIDWLEGRYADTYGEKSDKAVGELSVAEATAGLA